MSTNQEINEVTIKIMDKDFKISCPKDKLPALQESAVYLDKKMHEISKSGKIANVDHLAVITALNITRELMNYKHRQNTYIKMLTDSVKKMKTRIEEVLGVETT